MRTLGINRTQDASISLFENGQHVFSIQKERLTKTKHHWGKLGDIAIYTNYFPQLKTPANLIVECYSSDPEFENLINYHEELTREGLIGVGTKIIQMPHHLAHVFSLYPYTRFDGYAVMIIDAIGSIIGESTEDFPNKFLKVGEFEIASYYMCKNGGFKCLKKQTTTQEERSHKGLGKFYSHLRKAIFPGEGNEGKVMGLAAYGDKERFNEYPLLTIEDGEVVIPKSLLKLLSSGKYLFTNMETAFQEKADLAAFGQYLFEKALIEITEWLISETGVKKIAYAGGCALNCVANYKLTKEFQEIEFYIPPAPNDAGTSVGCAVYGNYKLGIETNFNWIHDYLGVPYSYKDFIVKNKGIEQGLNVIEPSNLEIYVADLIVKGYIICLYQGSSEFGPRALGNRSIICDSRYDILKHFINANIKGREWFRPIAPIILEDDVEVFFKNGFKSSHMLYCMEIHNQFKNLFSAIEHPNNHMRVQTINEHENIFLYQLLNQLKTKYNVPMIANTSFNGPNETIVETLDDAITAFKKYPIQYLVSPPYVFSKSVDTYPVLNY